MLALLHVTNREAKDDTKNEKQTLLPRRSSRRALCYRWVIALFLFSSSLCGSWLMYYSLRYCSTHGCMRGVEGQTDRGITVVPSLGLNVDWTHVALLGVYILVLAINFIYRGVQHVQWHIVSFAGFLLFQLMQATWTLVIHRNAFVVSQLEASWDNAYRYDQITLDQLQTRWQCQGFADIHDRASSRVSFETPCQPKLVSTFGHAIYVWGAALWTLKIIQLMGLFACYIIYLHFEDESGEEKPDIDEKSINYNTQPVNEKDGFI